MSTTAVASVDCERDDQQRVDGIFYDSGDADAVAFLIHKANLERQRREAAMLRNETRLTQAWCLVFLAAAALCHVLRHWSPVCW